jgi:hypothetical protein
VFSALRDAPQEAAAARLGAHFLSPLLRVHQKDFRWCGSGVGWGSMNLGMLNLDACWRKLLVHTIKTETLGSYDQNGGFLPDA